MNKSADAGGSPKDLAQLYVLHLDQVYRYIHCRCGDHGLTEDVIQDVFVSVVQSRTDPADLTVGWLCRVARNRMIDIVRRRSNLARKVGELQLVQGPPTANPTDSLSLDRIALTDALAGLSDLYRMVLLLRYLDDMTVQDLANHLGRTPKSVEALLRRARRALLAQMEETHV